MSSYSPDPAALPTGTPFIRQLSQRDVSLQIPINYVTVPGISLTPACFANQHYEDASAIRCFSNLLAVGFDRFDIDIYWDVTRQLWSLCPVELGDLTGESARFATTPPATKAERATSVQVWHSAASLVARDPAAATRSLSVPASEPGTKTTGHTTTSSSVSTTISPLSPTSTTGPSASVSLGNGTLIRVGPYSCTSSINLDSFTQVLSGHLDSTQYKLNATLKYFLLNMHAAAPASDPTGPGSAPPPGKLPHGSSHLSSILSSAVSSFLYTPTNLLSERSDLNITAGWFGNLERYHPDPAYFRIHKSGGHSATNDGWPGESWVEMYAAKRLLAGYGRIDPQLRQYNFSADASTIFPRGYLEADVSARLGSAGNVLNGCFYNAGIHSVAALNNSWAVSSESVSSGGGVTPLDPIVDGASDLTSCGISPMLNETLKDTTADQDFAPYKDYVQNTIWSWAPGQPENSSHVKQGTDSTKDRCAVLNATSGQWQTDNCARSHYSACRQPDKTYEWIISKFSTSFQKADLPCPDGTEFFVPRTALENTYLVHKWRQTLASDGHKDSLLWLNFNDLDAASCWVIGQNSTCPYLQGQQNHDREVLVPTVAAIIVFALAAATIFVKCAANRRQSKRKRRRGDDGWDYEGVPS